MATRLLQFFIGIAFFKVISSQYQPSVKQYIIRGPQSQSQQSYNQQPVIVERISALSLPNSPSSVATPNSISSLIGPIGSSGSIGSLIGPVGSTGSGPFVTTSPISSSGSISTSLFRPIGSSGSFFTTQNVNGPIISNGLASNSILSSSNLPSTSVPNSIASGKTLADLSGVLNGLQTIKSISDEGFCGTTALPQSLSGSSTNSLTQQSATKSIDSTVLNNLAIALQLLILNNMLNGESSECLPEAEPSLFEIIQPLPVKSMTSQQHNAEQKQMNYEYFVPNDLEADHKTNEPRYPNCNFVGSAGFAESPMLGLPPKSLSPAHPRSGKCLMSPYEALGNTHEPFGSSYRGLESPYSSMMGDNNDLFAMNDLF